MSLETIEPRLLSMIGMVVLAVISRVSILTEIATNYSERGDLPCQSCSHIKSYPSRHIPLLFVIALIWILMHLHIYGSVVAPIPVMSALGIYLGTYWALTIDLLRNKFIYGIIFISYTLFLYITDGFSIDIIIIALMPFASSWYFKRNAENN